MGIGAFVCTCGVLAAGLALWFQPADPTSQLRQLPYAQRASAAGSLTAAVSASEAPVARSTEAPRSVTNPSGQSAPQPLSQDEQRRLSALGDWEDDYRGKRHLSLRDDGTATMVVEPDKLGQAVFAAKLQFDIEWSIEDGRLKMHTLGGEPAGKVNLILKLYGNRTHQKILELTNDQLIVLDEDGKTKYTWRRRGGE